MEGLLVLLRLRGDLLRLRRLLLPGLLLVAVTVYQLASGNGEVRQEGVHGVGKLRDRVAGGGGVLLSGGIVGERLDLGLRLGIARFFHRGGEIVKEGELVFVYSGDILGGGENTLGSGGLLQVVYSQDEGGELAVVIAVVRLLFPGLGMYLELALLGVIGAGQDDGLPGRGHQELEQGLLLYSIVEHLAVHGQGGLPVLLIHEGQQPAQLGKKLLLVNNIHLQRCSQS